jgi:hypothetical protein
MRKFGKVSITDFITMQIYEPWGNIFGNHDVDAIFNSFLDMSLKIFYCSFPVKIKQTNITNSWITAGIRVSCHCKRELYLSCRSSGDQNLLNHYKVYCKILSDVITTAKKKLHYSRLILNSRNKIKATWSIVKSVTSKKSTTETVHQLNINGSMTNNPQIISDNFNDYFLTIADTINHDNSDGNNRINLIKNKPLDYLVSLNNHFLI